MSVVIDQTKVCSSCKEPQPPSAFTIDKQKSDGLSFYCRGCRSAKGRLAYASNPLIREVSKARAQAHWLLTAYGMTADDYAVMLNKQGGGCAVCGREQTDRRNARFCVDHDHETGVVRGLLCTPCNLMIGYAGDDVARLASAIHYLNGSVK